jgi:hypothetical protein
MVVRIEKGVIVPDGYYYSNGQVDMIMVEVNFTK